MEVVIGSYEEYLVGFLLQKTTEDDVSSALLCLPTCTYTLVSSSLFFLSQPI